MWHVRTQTLIASSASSGCIQSPASARWWTQLESDGKKLIHDHIWGIVIQLAWGSHQVYRPHHQIHHCINKSSIKMQTPWCITNDAAHMILNSCEGGQNCSGLNQYRLVWSLSEGGISELQSIANYISQQKFATHNQQQQGWDWPRSRVCPWPQAPLGTSQNIGVILMFMSMFSLWFYCDVDLGQRLCW